MGTTRIISRSTAWVLQLTRVAMSQKQSMTEPQPWRHAVNSERICGSIPTLVIGLILGWELLTTLRVPYSNSPFPHAHDTCTGA